VRKYTVYNFAHDEWDSATDKFRKWNWARNPDLYWRMPISFGPMPGPRQSFEKRSQNGLRGTFITASIKFKTSGTLLQNLFPNAAFSFSSPGTVAYASFSQTTLNQIEWLGGGGYRQFGLYIHGVQYTRGNGEVIKGTFMPVLFESLADPIVSGREELGMPKLYCSIDINQNETRYLVQTGWQGALFGKMELEGLQEENIETVRGTIGGDADDEILAWRYFHQAAINKGNAAVEHLTFMPRAKESNVGPSTVTKVQRALAATIAFDPLNWKRLPTLHHIITTLAEIPLYEIIDAKVVEGTGVPDVSVARKVN
jgi:hypothetical protein